GEGGGGGGGGGGSGEPGRAQVACGLRPGDGGGGAEPSDVGDRGPRRRDVPADRRARSSGGRAEDGAERERRGLDVRALRPEDAARDRRVAPGTLGVERRVPGAFGSGHLTQRCSWGERVRSWM